MGHYVLNHAALLLTWMGLLFLVAFVFVNWGFHLLVDISAAIGMCARSTIPPACRFSQHCLCVLHAGGTPSATPSRERPKRRPTSSAQYRAPAGRICDFGAQAGEYRKLDPSPLEEFIFYDHPSGHTRIWTAMRWKAAHLNDPDIKAGPVSPQ
jgi:STE24 endopeptidase